jgi:hypothetical protein
MIDHSSAGEGRSLRNGSSETTSGDGPSETLGHDGLMTATERMIDTERQSKRMKIRCTTDLRNSDEAQRQLPVIVKLTVAPTDDRQLSSETMHVDMRKTRN